MHKKEFRSFGWTKTDLLLLSLSSCLRGQVQSPSTYAKVQEFKIPCSCLLPPPALFELSKSLFLRILNSCTKLHLWRLPETSTHQRESLCRVMYNGFLESRSSCLLKQQRAVRKPLWPCWQSRLARLALCAAVPRQQLSKHPQSREGHPWASAFNSFSPPAKDLRVSERDTKTSPIFNVHEFLSLAGRLL